MLMSSKKKNVVIITHNKDVFTNPTLDIFFRKLIDAGTGVVLIAPHQYYYSSVSSQLVNIDVIPFIASYRKLSLINRFREYINFLKLLYSLLFLPKLAIIGVDSNGYVTAARLNRFFNKKLGYFSFEILFKEEISSYVKITGNHNLMHLKEKEEKYFHHCDFLLIQDEIRAQNICKENTFLPSNVFYIPVSNEPLGVDSPVAVALKKELNIPEDKKIIVFSGSVQPWTGIIELIDAMKLAWDARFVLLVHSRFKLKDGDPVYAKISEAIAKGMPVKLHNAPFNEFSSLASFISNCDYGIVSYIPSDHPMLGKNIEDIGLSSGKFSLFMMLGIPVIATKCRKYEILKQEYDFGKLIDSMEELPVVLPTLLESDNKHREACKKIYGTLLDPTHKMKDLLAYIHGK